MNKTKSSHALVIYKGKFLLLLRDDTPKIHYPNTWSLLGGGFEEDETPEQALLRELEEEANIKPKNVQYLFKLPNFEVYLFLVKLTDEEAKEAKLGNEGQKLDYFTLEELETIPLSGNIRDELPKYKNFLAKLVNE